MSPTASSTLSSFEDRVRAERGEMLDLMKQRIEEANRPKEKSVELSNAEFEKAEKTKEMTARQAELEKQQKQANNVQQQQQVESDVQAAYQAYCELLQVKEQREGELNQ